MNNTLQSAQSIANAYLTNFAKSTDFWQDFEVAFGSNYNKQTALNIKNSLTGTGFTLPEIVIVDSQILGTAEGAFAAQNNTIYLSQDFIKNNDSNRVAVTLIEEIGHWIDAQINTKDSTGDEGQIFSRLVTGSILTPTQLASLKAENDQAIITIDGQKLNVEQANFTGTNGDDTINGTAFTDTINGLAGNDTINAGSGDDTINAGLGSSDNVDGEAGNDLLIADFSESTKALNTAFVSDLGVNNYYGYFINSDFTRRVNFSSIERFNITGTSFGDEIIGGAGKDTLNGGAGKDYIVSGGGADVINGGTGIDSLELDLGSNTNNLTINITTGNFNVAGVTVTNTERFDGYSNTGLTTGSGNDIITGGRYNDEIATGDGDDTINAGLGYNVVQAGEGDDLLIVDYSSLTSAMNNTGYDYNYNGIAGYSSPYFNSQNTAAYLNFSGIERFNITGTAYGETINGGENKDTLKGGGGDDIISTGGGGNDTVDGGTGIDSIDLNLSSITTALTINITSTNFTAGGVTVTNVEAFDTLTTGSGNDTITGSVYNDTIISGNGNDTINAGLGKNTVTAGVGNDLLIIDYSSLNSAIDNNYTLTDNPTGYSGKYTSGSNFVEFTGVERFNITGNSDDDSIEGGKSIDILRGNAGNDDLTGGNGNDTYVIDADVDFGMDTIKETVADGDTDIIDFSSSTAAIKIDLGATTVQTVAANVQLLIPTIAVEGFIGGNGSDNITGGSGSQKLSGGNGADTYVIDADIHTGTDTINEIATAVGGIDTIDLRTTTTKAVTVNLGLTAAQTVAAGVQLVIPVVAIEKVYGGAGNDTLTGNTLNNTLFGGGGNDTLKGGTGIDSFLFSGGVLGTSSLTSRLGKDTISDFVSGQDKIVLSKATFSKITTPVTTPATPIGTNFKMVATDALAASSSEFITYSQASKTLFYNENGNLAGFGNGGGFATLTTTPSLVAGDFTIIA